MGVFFYMFLQKSKKFHSVLSFEANGLTLKYWFFSILSKLTPKFEACLNTMYVILLEVADQIWKIMDKVWILQGFLSVKQYSKNCSEKNNESTLIIIIS